MSAAHSIDVVGMRREIDEALDTNRLVRVGDTLVLMPDTVYLEGIANGRATTPTLTVVRGSDDRVVYVYKLTEAES